MLVFNFAFPLYSALYLLNVVPCNSAATIHQFCANNQLFTFSDEACPGGVLLKEPMELSEPCYCVNRNLTVYSDCSVRKESKHLQKVCRKWGHNLIRKKKHLIKLLQPVHSPSSYSFRANPKCSRILDACARLPENYHIFRDPFIRSDNKESPVHLAMGHIDHDDDRKIRSGRHKRDMSVQNVNDIKLRARIQETIDFLNDLQFGSGPGEDHALNQPKSMSLQALSKTLNIFNLITPSVIVNDETMNSIFTLFLEKYSALELPGISGNLAVDDFLDPRTFDEVMAKLDECGSKASDPSEEFEFASVNKAACPVQIGNLVYKVETAHYGMKRKKHQLGNFMPENRRYVPDKEDFLLGSLWKVFDTVYSYCFPYIFAFHSGQTFVNYHNIISNIFYHPRVHKDFYSDNLEGTLMYSSRIDHENLTALMKNIDSMDEAVHFASRFKQFFIKPKPFRKPVEVSPSPIVDNGIEGETEAPSSTPVETEAPTPLPIENIIESDTEPSQTTPAVLTRRRRNTINNEIESSTDWKALEIWRGKAYCLQLANPLQPASIVNTYPSIENFCQ